MIIINGKKFAKNNTEFTSTLFESGGTAYGFYKRLKNRIEFSDMQGKPFAALVVNPGKFSGFIDMTIVNGKKRYMFSHSNKVADIFGIPEGYSNGIKYAESIYSEA
jgi:hypothetical protein